MKMIICLICSIILLSNILMATENNDNKYDIKNIVGVSHSLTENNNKTFSYIELRDQICYEINDFPIIPFIEPNLFVGINNEKPNLFSSVLFGIRRKIIERQNLSFSVDLGTGVAVGFNDKNNAGILGRIGFDIAYHNIVFRCLDINLISGFIFKGTVSIGLGYSF
jgi:hypothetical protein